jgi:molecular chaperone GrpE
MPEENPPQKSDLPGEQPDQKVPMQIPELTAVDMLSAKIVELENGLGQYKDQLLRKAAEFENYKRRVENDYSTLVKFSKEDLILKMIPVLDDFERLFKAIRSSSDPSNGSSKRPGGTAESSGEDAFRRGMELIYNKFQKILLAQGVRPIEVLGKPFDPNYHDALLQIPRSDVAPHTVIDEVDKGYMLHDKVLRHAKVVVAADTGAGESSADGSDDGEGAGRE